MSPLGILKLYDYKNEEIIKENIMQHEKNVKGPTLIIVWDKEILLDLEMIFFRSAFSNDSK